MSVFRIPCATTWLVLLYLIHFGINAQRLHAFKQRVSASIKWGSVNPYTGAHWRSSGLDRTIVTYYAMHGEEARGILTGDKVGGLGIATSESVDSQLPYILEEWAPK